MASAKLMLRSGIAALLYRSRALNVLCSGKSSWRILMYHRITTPETCGYPLQPGMYVTPEHFAMQMEELQQSSDVIPLDKLCQAIANGEPPENSVAITFDDGWQDNYSAAFPILRHYCFPATVFLATSFIGSEQTFWSDTLPRTITFLRTCGLPAKECSYDARLPLEHHQRNELQAVLEAADSDFIERLDSYINRCKSFTEQHRNQLADTLAIISSEAGAATPPRAFLNWQEVSEMAAAGISFGSHTHSHIPLPELSEADQREELQESLTAIRQRGISPSKIFCYPEGRLSQSTQQTLKAEGLAGALATSRKSQLNEQPPLFGRIGIHDDIAATKALFATRVWLQR